MATKRKSPATKDAVSESSPAKPDQQYQVRLPGELYERLRRWKFDTRKDMRELILHGIELALKEEKY